VTDPNRVLRNLRNTRDFRAELLDIAASLADNAAYAAIHIDEPAISEETIRAEWDRLIVAVKPTIAKRMRLELTSSNKKGKDASALSKAAAKASRAIELERPNYRAEVLRLLIGASFANDGMWSVKNLIKKIGASQTPVRQALLDLKLSGLVQDWSGSHVDIAPEDLSAESLAKLQAAPQTLRFRFERGTPIRTPAALLERALPLLRRHSEGIWNAMALSGVAVAQAEVPVLDLVGIPRLDLVAFIPRHEKIFDADALRQLSDGLEYETNLLAPAPVVVTLVRAEQALQSDVRRAGVIDKVRCAAPIDVFLSLLDMNFRQQAYQYAKAIQQ